MHKSFFSAENTYTGLKTHTLYPIGRTEIYFALKGKYYYYYYCFNRDVENNDL